MNLFGEKNSLQSTDEKPKEVRETRCTCSACGNVWYYGKEEVQKNNAAKMHQVGKAMMCCGGCFPALLIPNREVADLDKSINARSAALKRCGRKLLRTMSRIAVLAIRTYQKTFSPILYLLGVRCRFYPSCSAYAVL